MNSSLLRETPRRPAQTAAPDLLHNTYIIYK